VPEVGRIDSGGASIDGQQPRPNCRFTFSPPNPVAITSTLPAAGATILTLFQTLQVLQKAVALTSYQADSIQFYFFEYFFLSSSIFTSVKFHYLLTE
jgi:hypothetical protein